MKTSKGGIVKGSIPAMIQPGCDIPLTLKPIDWGALSDNHKDFSRHMLDTLYTECMPRNEIRFVTQGPDREFIDAVKVILEDSH